MTVFETWSIVIGIANTVVILSGLIFAYGQLKLLVRTHSDNHEWNRRSVTQEALVSFGQAGKTDRAVSYFLEQDRNTPILKDEIIKKFNEHSDLQTEVHTLLNFYESLARGVKSGIYDEGIVINARQGSMRRCLRIFQEYINQEREQNQKYWIEFEQLVRKWEGEDASLAGKAPIGSIKQ